MHDGAWRDERSPRHLFDSIFENGRCGIKIIDQQTRMAVERRDARSARFGAGCGYGVPDRDDQLAPAGFRNREQRGFVEHRAAVKVFGVNPAFGYADIQLRQD